MWWWLASETFLKVLTVYKSWLLPSFLFFSWRPIGWSGTCVIRFMSKHYTDIYKKCYLDTLQECHLLKTKVINLQSCVSLFSMFQKCCYHSASCRQVFVDKLPSSIQTTGCCNNLLVTKVFTGTFLVFVTIYISGYTLFPIASWAIGLCDWALRDCCHLKWLCTWFWFI